MLSYKLTSVYTRNARRSSEKITHPQAWSRRLCPGTPTSEEAFLALRQRPVSGGPDHYAVFVTSEHSAHRTTDSHGPTAVALAGPPHMRRQPASATTVQ